MSNFPTTATDRKYADSVRHGSTLDIGDVTIDSLGNRYEVTVINWVCESFGGDFIGRVDLNLIDGKWVKTGRMYLTSADSNFMVVTADPSAS